MKLIVGLGNPGDEYKLTRHNTGFMFIEGIERKRNLTFKVDNDFIACIASTIINGEKVIFLKPLTFMNSSGEAVFRVCNYYKIEKDDILVIYDDMDLNPGDMRFRKNGSSGGHKGMKSIIDYMETSEIKRLRIGIGEAKYDVIDYVLKPYADEEKPLFEKIFNDANNILEEYLSLPFGDMMAKYNKKVKKEVEDEKQ